MSTRSAAEFAELMEIRAYVLAWGKARMANLNTGIPPLGYDDDPNWSPSERGEVRAQNALADLADRIAVADAVQQ